MRKLVVTAAAASAALLAALSSVLAHPFSSVSIGEGAKLADYKSAYVAPVATDLPEVARYDRSGGDRPVDPADAALKAADLQKKLSDALGKKMTMATGPGPGVLTVSTTLTRLQSSRPTRADYAREPNLDFDSVYAGGATARFEFSEEGKALGAIVGDYDATLSDGWPRVGIWDDVDRAFWSWSRAMADFIADR